MEQLRRKIHRDSVRYRFDDRTDPSTYFDHNYSTFEEREFRTRCVNCADLVLWSFGNNFERTILSSINDRCIFIGTRCWKIFGGRNFSRGISWKFIGNNGTNLFFFYIVVVVVRFEGRCRRKVRIRKKHECRLCSRNAAAGIA